MKNVPSLLLLLMVVAAGPGSSPTPALAQQCTHQGFVDSVNSNVTINMAHTSASVYVRPLPGFKGISLIAVTEEEEEYAASFPTQGTCFQGDADFWEISVAVWLSNATPDDSNGIYFRMWTDGCPSQCYYTATVDKLEKFIVMGHGPSYWSYKTPDPSCTTRSIWNIRVKDSVHCTSAITTGTNATFSGPITPTRHAMSTTGRHNTATPAATTTTPHSTVVMVAVVVVLGIVLGMLSVVAVRMAVLVKKLKERQDVAHSRLC